MTGFNKTPLLSPRNVALTLLLLQAPFGLAAPMNNDRVQVQADYMKFDLNTGSSTYEGGVKITHNNIEIYGETVIILSESNEIQQINVDGQPARYIQDEHTENSIYATSQHMQYFSSRQKLVMTGDARLEQPDHTIESQRIVYDTLNKIVMAGSEDSKPEGRVNIILKPKKDNPAPTDTEKP